VHNQRTRRRRTDYKVLGDGDYAPGPRATRNTAVRRPARDSGAQREPQGKPSVRGEYRVADILISGASYCTYMRDHFLFADGDEEPSALLPIYVIPGPPLILSSSHE